MNKILNGLFLSVSLVSLVCSFAIRANTGNIKQTNRIKAIDLAHYSKRDIKDEVFYFVLPDRFSNGDKSNDLGAKANDKKRALSRGGFDPKDIDSYHGGDLIGLTEKLPYLEEMGITSIWLTPILRNQAVQGSVSGYHGYWVLDFTEIDPHLGSNQDLKNLIDSAHQRNIKIFFDIITNHTADVVKYTQCHGKDGKDWSVDSDLCPYKSLAQLAQGDGYTTVVPKGMEQLKTPLWLNDATYYHNQGDSTFSGENSINGDFFGLDDLNTNDDKVVKGMTAIFKNLISEFKPDGFRIDTVKHVNIEFWQQFSPALITHAQSIGIENFFMFGEVYSADAKVLSKYTTQGKIPSVLDFGFQKAVQEVLVNQKGTHLLAELFERDTLYKDQDSDASTLLNFTGNHDMGRFAHMLKESKFNYSEPAKIQRSLLANALMFFARGIPVIYYGDEQGFVGDGGNHESRQDMMPSKVATYNDDDLLANNKSTRDDNFDQENLLYQSLSTYAQLYQQHAALRHGQQNTLYAQKSAGLFVFNRVLTINGKAQNYLLVFNSASTEQVVAFDNVINALPNKNKLIFKTEQAEHTLIVNPDKIEITTSPLSFSIYKQIN